MMTEYIINQVVKGIESGLPENVPVCVVPTKELADEFIRKYSGRGRHFNVVPTQRITSLPLSPNDDTTINAWCLVY